MKIFFLAVGWVSFAIGLIGIFVPVLPTTPFMILSAACFSKSSPKFYQFILSRPMIGPAILEWQKFGLIRKRAKILATVFLVVSFAILVVREVSLFIIVPFSVVASLVLGFIWTRPSSRSQYDQSPEQGEKNMQIRARHILVEQEFEAQDIIRHLQEGKEFSDLAAKYSKCPSGQQGGDLGVFNKGQMVKPFEEAVLALEVGQVSTPVQTQFGYHVIERQEV